MIIPTVGRVILWFPSAGEQPWPALICKVQSNTCINVGGFNPEGQPFARTDVTLIQDDKVPALGSFAAWMPYQAAQAARVEHQQMDFPGAKETAKAQPSGKNKPA